MRILGLCLFLCKALLFCLDLNYPFSALQLASSNLSLLKSNPASAFHNPSISDEGLIFSYFSPFSISEIQLASFAYNKKYQKNNIFLGTQYINDAEYQEYTMFAGLSRNLEFITFASNLRYLYQKTASYSKVTAYLLDSGILFNSKHFQSTVYISNLTESSFKKIKLPQRYNAEFLFPVLKKARLALAIEKENSDITNYKIGTNISLYPDLVFITSHQTESKQTSYGIFFKIKKYELGYAIQSHPDLNLSHAISFCLK